MLGGGQLGRMSTMAASKLGFFTHIFEPQENGPAALVAAEEINASFLDKKAVEKFADRVDVVTLEFENIPVQTLRWIEARRPVRPGAQALEICQHREREKLFLRSKGFPHAEFRVVTNAIELAKATEELGFPCVLKSAEFGYDGKGQVKLQKSDDLKKVWKDFGFPRGVLEEFVRFDAELSVITARTEHDECLSYPVAENIHTNHILEFSIVPGRFEKKVIQQAMRLGKEITRELGVVGLLAVEMFLRKDGKIVVNELAPRPHNSGHYTLDACVTSQFEQHIRAVCGLSLGSVEQLKPVVMYNILGDAWSDGDPRWDRLLALPELKLHLYQKHHAKPGRKMGHVNCLASTLPKALAMAEKAKKILHD